MTAAFRKAHVVNAFICIALFASSLAASVKWVPGHYILVYKGANQSSFDKAINAPHVKGVQVRYLWNDLETSKGRYDFSQIQSDLALLRSHGKYLIIQIEEKAMNADAPYAPDYILNDPEYEGGVYNMKPGGWAPRYWVASVMDRICALYAAMGAEFDSVSNVAAVNTQETALDNAGTDDRNATGYTAVKYVAALKRGQSALKNAFPHTVTLQYMNYLPGGTQVGGEAEMRVVAEHCEVIGAGIGGPDNTPDGSGSSFYPIIRDMKGKMPLAIASQTRSYTSGFTARQLVDYAVDNLAVNFAVWLRYTSGTMTIDDILVEIGRQGGRINEAVPANLQVTSTETVLPVKALLADEHRTVVQLAHPGSRSQPSRCGYLDLAGRRGTADGTKPKSIVLFSVGQ